LREDESYEATKLGAAIVASSFSPDDGLFIYQDLKRALEAFVMDGEMHIFYMFTPLSVAMNNVIDWIVFRDQLDALDESGIRALQFVGVQPGFVNNMYAGRKMNVPFSIHISNSQQGPVRTDTQRR
jgi:DNA polymerase theta